QVFLALLAVLAFAPPDLRGLHGGLHGSSAGALELFEPSERQPIDEFAAPMARGGEEVDEFFDDDAPDAHLRALRRARLQDRQPPRWSHSLTASRRHGGAHQPTGPPTA